MQFKPFSFHASRNHDRQISSFFLSFFSRSFIIIISPAPLLTAQLGRLLFLLLHNNPPPTNNHHFTRPFCPQSRNRPLCCSSFRPTAPASFFPYGCCRGRSRLLLQLTVVRPTKALLLLLLSNQTNNFTAVLFLVFVSLTVVFVGPIMLSCTSLQQVRE
jgi:hypothetical protein